MVYKHTLSALEWHEDGTMTSTIWQITPAELDEVTTLLAGRPATHGIITAEQARQASDATRSWLTYQDT